MNLVEIQENLKDLPTQAIMAYANGQNPEVPPYIALGELNRRKSMEQRAAQPPTQSVKDQLEAQVGGLPSVMPPPVAPQGAPQAMPPGAPPQMPRPAMPPQGIQQQMPPQRPPMQAAPQMAPQRMAAGGLTNVPMNRDIFKYAPGGIVAFAEGELVPGGGGEMGEDTAGEAEARANMGNLEKPVTQPSGVSSLVGDATQALRAALKGESSIPAPVDKEAVRAELIKNNPEMAAILSKIPGDTLMKLVSKLQAQNEASKAQFQEGEGKMGLAALSNALISAGEATRGAKGLGLGEAFGGFGKSYNAATAEEIKRKQAQQALERAQDIEVAKLQADTEAMQRAFAEGRVNDAMELKKSIAERQAKIDANKLQAGEKVLSQATTEQQMQGTLAHYKALEQNEALKLKEMIQQHADQNAIQRQQLAAQQANYASEAAHRKAQDDLAAATKPTAEEKLDMQTQTRINSDPAIRELSKKLATTDLGSDDYYDTLSRIREIAITHYPQGAKLPPPVVRTPPVQPPAKPSFWDRMTSGMNSISTMGSDVPAARPSNAVRFEDLPK